MHWCRRQIAEREAPLSWLGGFDVRGLPALRSRVGNNDRRLDRRSGSPHHRRSALWSLYWPQIYRVIGGTAIAQGWGLLCAKRVSDAVDKALHNGLSARP